MSISNSLEYFDTDIHFSEDDTRRPKQDYLGLRFVEDVSDEDTNEPVPARFPLYSVSIEKDIYLSPRTLISRDNWRHNSNRDVISSFLLYEKWLICQLPSRFLSRHLVTVIDVSLIRASAPIEKFISRLRSMQQASEIDSALDLIYDHCNALMSEGNFEDLDLLLKKLPIEEFKTDILLGFLSATLPGKSNLKQRESLFMRVESVIDIRREAEPGLLTGLA